MPRMRAKESTAQPTVGHSRVARMPKCQRGVLLLIEANSTAASTSSPSWTSRRTSRATPATASEMPNAKIHGSSGKLATRIAPNDANSAVGAYQGGHCGRADSGSSGSRTGLLVKGGAPRRSRARARADPAEAQSPVRRWRE